MEDLSDSPTSTTVISSTVLPSLMFFSLRILNDSSSSPSPPFSAAAEDSAATLLPPSNLALGVSEMVVAFVRFAKGVYSWLIPAMVVILTTSIVGNGLIVVSAPFLRRTTNHYNRLCVSLAAADAWAASLLVAGLIVNSYRPIVLDIPKTDECMSAFLEIFRIAGMLTSLLHILALAVNQFIGIVYPLQYKRLVTTRRIRILMLLLWLVPILFVALWFFVIPSDGFHDIKCRQRFYGRFPFRLYIFVAFTVPLFITYAIYIHILLTLLKAKAKCDTSSSLRRSSQQSIYSRRVKSKLKLMWTTLLILSTFTLSWGVCVLYFVIVCKEGCLIAYMKTISFEAGLMLNSSVNLLVALKLLFNPLIYALRMRHIRMAVFQLLFVLFPPLKSRFEQPRSPYSRTHTPMGSMNFAETSYADIVSDCDSSRSSPPRMGTFSLSLRRTTSSSHKKAKDNNNNSDGGGDNGGRRTVAKWLSVPQQQQNGGTPTTRARTTTVVDSSDEGVSSFADDESDYGRIATGGGGGWWRGGKQQKQKQCSRFLRRGKQQRRRRQSDDGNTVKKTKNKMRMVVMESVPSAAATPTK